MLYVYTCVYIYIHIHAYCVKCILVLSHIGFGIHIYTHRAVCHHFMRGLRVHRCDSGESAAKTAAVGLRIPFQAVGAGDVKAF